VASLVAIALSRAEDRGRARAAVAAPLARDAQVSRA
jgi:hypothetical protein